MGKAKFLYTQKSTYKINAGRKRGKIIIIRDTEKRAFLGPISDGAWTAPLLSFKLFKPMLPFFSKTRPLGFLFLLNKRKGKEEIKKIFTSFKGYYSNLVNNYYF